jgi:hypothetical protein
MSPRGHTRKRITTDFELCTWPQRAQRFSFASSDCCVCRECGVMGTMSLPRNGPARNSRTAFYDFCVRPTCSRDRGIVHHSASLACAPPADGTRGLRGQASRDRASAALRAEGCWLTAVSYRPLGPRLRGCRNTPAWPHGMPSSAIGSWGSDAAPGHRRPVEILPREYFDSLLRFGLGNERSHTMRTADRGVGRYGGRGSDGARPFSLRRSPQSA